MTATPLLTNEGLVDLERLPLSVLTPESIGSSLAKINRYAGRTQYPWSVAYHSIFVSQLCTTTTAQVWGLLHDAHKAFIGDIISPAVDFIASQYRAQIKTGIKNCVAAAKVNLDEQIANAWRVDLFDIDARKEVEFYDHLALETEMKLFFKYDGFAWTKEHDRALDLLGSFPIDHWITDKNTWVRHAELFAKLGYCTPPKLSS